MRRSRALWLAFTIATAGCAYRHRLASASVETAMPRTWFMVAAPFTREFPRGSIEEPLSEWSTVTTYENDGACNAALFDVENQLQRPLECVASDDPRLAKK